MVLQNTALWNLSFGLLSTDATAEYVAQFHQIRLPDKRRKVTSPLFGIDRAGALCRIPEGALVDVLATGDEFVEVLWQARVCRLSKKDIEENTNAAESE